MYKSDQSINALHGLIEKIGSVSFVELEKHLQEITLEDLKEFLFALLDSPEKLSEVALFSYHHENGFDKIVLSNKQQYKIRLHIWWQDRNGAFTENIHDHRWSFLSRILTGAYVNEIYVQTNYGVADGVNKCHFIYRPRLGKDYYELIYLQQANLRLTSSTLHRAGEVVGLSYSQIHRITISGKEMTSTIFITGPEEKEITNVFGDCEEITNAKVSSLPFTPLLLSEKIIRFLESIDNL